MKTSEQGLKLLHGREGCPPDSRSHLVDGRDGDAVLLSEHGNVHAIAALDANGLNLCRAEFGGRLPFAAQVNQSTLPLMPRVRGAGDPLQIGRQIVELTAVDVVDRKAGFFAGDKRSSHKPVHLMLRALVAALLRHKQIAVVSNMRRQGLRRTTLSGPDALRYANVPKIGNLKLCSTVRHRAPLFLWLHGWTLAQTTH